MSDFVRSVLKGTWIYSLILWGYVVADNLIYDFAHQYQTLSIYIPIPEDVVAVFAFAVSFVCFVGWEFLRKER